MAMFDKTVKPKIIDRLEHEQIKRLEFFSVIEATTLVFLACIAMPLNHVFGWPLGSRILGPIHGVAFLAFTWTALQTVAGGRWSGRDMARLFVAAFVPFGGFFNIRWLRQKAGVQDGDRTR